MMVARKTKIKNIIKNCGTDKTRRADSRKVFEVGKKADIRRLLLVFTDLLASVKKNE